MIELRHLVVRNFVIEENHHLANGCTAKCGCIGLMLFRYQSCLGAITCDINNVRFVSVHPESMTLWLQVVQPFPNRS